MPYVTAFLWGCTPEPRVDRGNDGGHVKPDAGTEPPDGGPSDSGPPDAGNIDAGPGRDAGPRPDAGPGRDAGGEPDAGPEVGKDGGPPGDGGSSDAGSDAGADAGTPECRRGDTDIMICGDEGAPCTGSQSRVCGDDEKWGGWSACSSDGTECTDSDECTTQDHCSSGYCAGVPKVYESGVCGSGDCAGTKYRTCAGGVWRDWSFCSTNTQACSDEHGLCTTGETCDADGACGAPVTTVQCSPADQCKTAGECAPATGLCDNAPRTGTSCDTDSDKCTPQICTSAGTCASPSTRVICPPPPRTPEYQCKTEAACDAATGTCPTAFPNKPNNPPVACNDENLNTDPDQCSDGICVGTQIPGVNYRTNSVSLTNSVDVDQVLGANAVRVFGGGHPDYYMMRCAVDALLSSACVLSAKFIVPGAGRTTPIFDPDMVLISYDSLVTSESPPRHLGYAVARAPSGSPVVIARVNENETAPLVPAENAVEAYERISEWVIRSGSSVFRLPISNPAGVVAYSASAPSAFLVAGNTGYNGALLAFSEQSGNLLAHCLPGTFVGFFPTAVARTRLNLDGAEKNYIAVLESGTFLPEGAPPAPGISIFTARPEMPERVAHIPLEAGVAHHIAELKLDPVTQKVAYVQYTTSAGVQKLAIVNLESGAISTIILVGGPAGVVTDMAVTSSHVYISDESRRITAVNLASGQVVGHIDVRQEVGVPRAMAWVGGYLYFVAGSNLAAISPSEVQWHQ